MLHPAGKGLLVNPLIYRLDMFRHLDGILDEYGDFPAKMLTSALLGLAMPVLAWDHCGGSVASQKSAVSCAVDHSSFDEFLGQHLYLGVQPMGPFVNQSHGVLTSPAHLRVFEDWGPLFKALRGKQWLLTPDAVALLADDAHPSAQRAKANIFAVGAPGSRYVVAVVAGGANATLAIAPLAGASWPAVTASALLPGTAAPVALQLREQPAGGATLVAPLHRGAALCVLEVDP